MMYDVPIPRGPQDLTPDWLSGVLGVRLAAVQVDDLGAFGIGGRLVLLRPTYAEAMSMPQTLVAKLAPADDAVRHRLNDLGVFRGEVGFYAELATDGELPTPRCWFAAYDPEEAHFTIVMEDLSAGWTGQDDRGLTPAETLAVARALARLHGRWWQADRLSEVEWLREWGPRMAGLGQRLAAAAPQAVARFHDDIDGRLLALIAELPERLVSLPQELSGEDFTLVHGDIQPRNIIFTGSPSDPSVAFLDWGSVIRGPAALDICNLLSLCLEPHQRREGQTRILDAYLEQLQPKITYTYEHLVLDYQQLLRYRLARTLVVGSVTDEGSGAEAMTRRNLRRVCDAMLDGP
jgi:hypothetical protein